MKSKTFSGLLDRWFGGVPFFFFLVMVCFVLFDRLRFIVRHQIKVMSVGQELVESQPGRVNKNNGRTEDGDTLKR